MERLEVGEASRLSDVGRTNEAEGADRRVHHDVADAGLVPRRSGIPGDLNEVGLAEDEQHDLYLGRPGLSGACLR